MTTAVTVQPSMDSLATHLLALADCLTAQTVVTEVARAVRATIADLPSFRAPRATISRITNAQLGSSPDSLKSEVGR